MEKTYPGLSNLIHIRKSTRPPPGNDFNFKRDNSQGKTHLLGRSYLQKQEIQSLLLAERFFEIFDST